MPSRLNCNLWQRFQKRFSLWSLGIGRLFCWRLLVPPKVFCLGSPKKLLAMRKLQFDAHTGINMIWAREKGSNWCWVRLTGCVLPMFGFRQNVALTHRCRISIKKTNTKGNSWRKNEKQCWSSTLAPVAFCTMPSKEGVTWHGNGRRNVKLGDFL